MNHGDEETHKRRLNELSGRVIGLAMEVHRELGPGLLESAYEEALAHELMLAGLKYRRQVEVPLSYKGVHLNCGYRLDFLVQETLILELKAVAEVLPIHRAQLLTYLKLQQQPLGLLINWNAPVLKDGIKRVVSGQVFKVPRPSLLSLLCVSVSLWFTSPWF